MNEKDLLVKMRDVRPGIFRVLLKRLIGDFNVYSDHYDMMRQQPISQKQYDDVTKVKTKVEI